MLHILANGLLDVHAHRPEIAVVPVQGRIVIDTEQRRFLPCITPAEQTLFADHFTGGSLRRGSNPALDQQPQQRPAPTQGANKTTRMHGRILGPKQPGRKRRFKRSTKGVRPCNGADLHRCTA